MNIRRISLVVVLLSMLGCSSDPEQRIALEFEPYVNQFFAEGRLRGFETGLEEIDLIIEFGEVQVDGTGGDCTFRTNTIVMDQTTWNRLDDENRHWLVAHELGHCVLDRRGHRNDKGINSECFSIMRGVEDNFQCSLNLYSELWWEYYYDELFLPVIAFPTWYSAYNPYDGVAIESVIINIDTIANELSVSDVDLSNYDDFRIDLQFENSTTEEVVVQFYLGNIVLAHCDPCTGTNVSIRDGIKKLHNNYEGDIRFDSDIKLSIIKIGDQLYFYVNERFIHTFEASLWDMESTISTINFDQLIGMQLIISELEG